MKAMVFARRGKVDSLVVKEVPKPAPKGRDVLVRVADTSLSFVDVTMMSKVFRTPGAEVSGVVEAVGERVTKFRPGDEVMGLTKGMHSGWAEYALARESDVASKDPGQSFEDASTVSMAGVTAWQAVRAARVEAGQEVLIIGASGGVGGYVLQLCKMRGARVTAVVSARNVDLARQEGADAVIDYREHGVDELEGTFDRIIAVNGNNPLKTYKRLLSPEGRYACVGGMSQVMKTALLGWLESLGSKKRMGISSVFLADKQEAFAGLNKGIGEGRIRPHVDRVYDMCEIKEAIAYATGEHPQGKVVIRVRSDDGLLASASRSRQSRYHACSKADGRAKHVGTGDS